LSVLDIQFLCRPRTVAVIGATDRKHSIGAVVMRNLLRGGFAGPILPVNPNHEPVAGVLAYPTIERLPLTPELAIICTPASSVLDIAGKLGTIGTRAAIIVSSGTERTQAPDGRSVHANLTDLARSHNMRILGPNCLGLMVPGHGLNASFSHQFAERGKLAFISQSGALCTAVLDWAQPRGIGFSHFVSLGDAIDIDFGDFLDYLAFDAETRAILLYIEGIQERRNFMSAARAAARNKPVIAIKAGRHSEGARAAKSHTGVITGADAVYDAALARAGILRVHEMEELFAAAETLGRSPALKGERLAILTNGGGIGVMAVDELTGAGRLATLDQETIAKLDVILPSAWSRSNPVDILGDADGKRYALALDILIGAKGVDAVLCMHAPTAITSPTEIAEAVIATARRSGSNMLMACWMGNDAVKAARSLFGEAAIPSYETPTQAIRAFQHLVRHRQTQEVLMAVPPSAPVEFVPDTGKVRSIVAQALASGAGGALSKIEANSVLAAYGIGVVRTEIARDPAEAGRIAKAMGAPVALKLLSPDLAHKSDVGGVMLNLQGAFEVEKSAHAMKERAAQLVPEARIDGFVVQLMARRPGAVELVIGLATDQVFGPVISFGQGGVAMEAIDDIAVDLPPLNMSLALRLVEKTRVYRLLKGARNRPAADLDRLCMALVQVAQLIIDIPEIVTLDINPLFVDPSGILAVDAAITIAPYSGGEAKRLAIRPYPQGLEERFVLENGQAVMLRPVRAEDEPAHHVFVSRLSPEDLRFRFFGVIREISHKDMARLLQIDYDREMAFIATSIDAPKETLGVVRTIMDPDNQTAEYAILVRSDVKGLGLGRKLLEKMIGYCRSRGTRQMTGQVMLENRAMLGLIASLGFVRTGQADTDIVEVALDLKP
jgi:acetyltransferase